MTAGTAEQNNESLWEMSRVTEETPALVGAGILGTHLVKVIGKVGDLMKVWLEEEIFKMLVSGSPMLKPLERKAIGMKLKEKNRDWKERRRFLKYWGESKLMGFTWDTIGAAEAERLEKNSIKSEGKIRKVSVLRKGEQGKLGTSLLTKMLVLKGLGKRLML